MSSAANPELFAAFREQGILWFTDLASTDVVLPFIFIMISLSNIRMSRTPVPVGDGTVIGTLSAIRGQMLDSPFLAGWSITDLLNMLLIIMGLGLTQAPAAVSLYVASSAAIGAGLRLLIRSNAIQTALSNRMSPTKLMPEFAACLPSQPTTESFVSVLAQPRNSQNIALEVAADRWITENAAKLSQSLSKWQSVLSRFSSSQVETTNVQNPSHIPAPNLDELPPNLQLLLQKRMMQRAQAAATEDTLNAAPVTPPQQPQHSQPAKEPIRFVPIPSKKRKSN